MDNLDIARFVFAFLLVIALIGIMAMLLKRFGASGKWMGAQQESDRIQLLQTRYLDPKRKLVLVRCDDKEHLLLLSESRELVIEANIPARNDHA